VTRRLDLAGSCADPQRLVAYSCASPHHAQPLRPPAAAGGEVRTLIVSLVGEWPPLAKTASFDLYHSQQKDQKRLLEERGLVSQEACLIGQ
jgi:hypothetical protein